MEMTVTVAGIFVVALLYSSVGHAGASGYIAVMSMMHLAPATIKPVALTLNIVVASIGAWQFRRSGHFVWRKFWPFALLSVPCAFAGGYIHLPAEHFKFIIGIVLLYSAVRLVVKPPPESNPSDPPRGVAVATGGAIGFLSGLTGTGGGIFLTPILLFRHWARAKEAAAISVFFILVNSTAGLLGNISSTGSFPSFAMVLVAAALAGGAIGSHFGARRFDPLVIKRLLAIVLLIAGSKLVIAIL